MNKQIGIVIAVLVVLAGGYYIFVKSAPVSNPAMQDGTSAPLESTNPNASGKKMAFSEFIKQGGAYECIVHQSISNTYKGGEVHVDDTMGTVYIDNDKILVNFGIVVSGKDGESYMLKKDGYMYMWTSLAPTMGVKMAVPVSTSQNPEANVSGSPSFNADQMGDYDCRPWTVNESVFVVPTSVKFTDMAQMMKQ